jgi:TMEM175 potassium channel family protein
VGNRWETGRTEAFSDGVFAIAITLLVLDIGVPASEFDDLWSAIFHEWPAYLGYATSFLTIGGLWLAHHGIFRRLRYANNRVMQVNLLLLMAVSFLPFPTRLVAERSATRAPSAPQRSSTARACSRSRCCSAPFGEPSHATAGCSSPR